MLKEKMFKNGAREIENEKKAKKKKCLYVERRKKNEAG